MVTKAAVPFHGRPASGSNHPHPSGEMVWGRRRDFLPGSQEVKWRDGNPRDWPCGGKPSHSTNDDLIELWTGGRCMAGLPFRETPVGSG